MGRPPVEPVGVLGDSFEANFVLIEIDFNSDHKPVVRLGNSVSPNSMAWRGS